MLQIKHIEVLIEQKASAASALIKYKIHVMVLAD